MSRLLLFDIDCTLIDTGGAGMAALKQAACELFGADGPELDLAGSTDAGIVMGMLDHFSRDLAHETFYEVYLNYLSPNLAQFTGSVLPGVVPLLDSLVREDVAVGLLTGNIAEGAWEKLRHYGLHDYFAFGAFGDDHHDRNRLGPVALERASAHYGNEFSAEKTVVIGDTPKDIACGKAIGAVTLAVATGGFSSEQLELYQPDHLFEDLQSDQVLDVLLSV
ncbi:HAD family hydrolase [Verrucomicrobiaceae bacterium N1E253]|uniref:phosphoglycolate phosphatase n=1 Tax=Oceaniferula marina TaxID=2748318 RepID=A0A851GI24_9BACT|nr:HAD family hydrolase [Oceaniferula marina]NWK57173.1 HAD family hydrolase [Oceaniferula marina]